MEQSKRDKILNNLDKLVEKTPDVLFESLLSEFSSNFGLSPRMIEKINIGTIKERKRKFYEIIPKRGPEAFNKLCDCLYKLNIRELAEFLKSNRLMVEGCCHSKTSEAIKNTTKYNEYYKIASKPKGHVLIINNKNFMNKDEYRFGSENDVAALKKVWSKLGYNVIVKEDLGEENFKMTIDNFINMAGSDKLDSVFIFIMTHGKGDKRDNMEIEQLEMSDSQFIRTDWILRRFSSIHSTHLIDIPKVIFIQACRGHHIDTGYWVKYDSASENLELNGSVDGNRTNIEPRPHFNNLLVVYATLPGFVAKRYQDGAPFIQELCRVIESKASEFHLIEIINKVNANLQNEGSFILQGPDYESLGFSKKLYLV